MQGVKVDGRNFAGGAFDWVTGFSMMVGVALVFGYALLGATWLIMQTEDITQSCSLCSDFRCDFHGFSQRNYAIFKRRNSQFF